jgi:hypothetical protein
MKESPDVRFKPADRRWNLVGMVIGAIVGAVPAAFPGPIAAFVNWVVLGIGFGFMIPFYFSCMGIGMNFATYDFAGF